MQLILPDLLQEARGMSLAVYAITLVIGAALWLTGWWGHRFWIVLFTTVAAGIAGLSSGRATGVQPFAAGVLLAVTAGMMALALARMAAFVAGGIATWLVVRAVVPAWEEPLLTFLGGGLVGLAMFRAWAMVLSSLAGTLLMAYAGLGLADKLGKIDALEWSEKRVVMLNSICLGVALFGWAVQFAIERHNTLQARQRKEKAHLDAARKDLDERFKRHGSRWWKWGAKPPMRRAA